MDYELSDVLISKEHLEARVKELGRQISDHYRNESLVVVGILRGAVIFMADLVRQISPDVLVSLDFMAVSSYGASTQSSGVVKILKDLDNTIRNKNVLIVEDIVDSGLTLSYLKKVLLSRDPKSLRICVLLDKKERRVADLKTDFCGFDIPDKFVVGYGLDYAGIWRNLPAIHEVKSVKK